MVATTPTTLTLIKDQYNNYVTLTDASPGASRSHSYRLTLPGYQDVIGNVTVTAGQTASVTGTFTGNTSISSTPSGASIWIDGIDKGLTTPNTVTGLSQGTHNYTLKLSGYQDFVGSFSISPGTTTTVPQATFAGSAYITSTPIGASVYLDGSPTSSGTTPLTIKNLTSPSSGATLSHNYILRLTGYADVSSSFTATAGSTTSVPVTFPPSASFTSTPSGASINLDGTSIGTTPITITNVAEGSHNYTATLSGYTDYAGSFTATAGSMSNVPVTFAGSAYFTSVPTGAEIFLAASPGTPSDQGIQTPNTIKGLTTASPGATTVWNYKLTLTGYADVSNSFTATAGSTTSIPVTFPGSTAYGSASFTSSPSGARIWIDGANTGTNTPGTITSLSVGSHNYRLTLVGYADSTGTFSVTEGMTTTVPLVTFVASAYITSTPSNSSIYLDGSGSSSGTTPATITGLSDGIHTYRLVHSGYADISDSFTASAGSTTNVPVTFSGSAYLTTTPSGAEIYLATSPGTPTDQSVQTPSTITGMTTASSGATTLWNYKVTLSGYADVSDSFTATAGQTINVGVTFPGSAYVTSTPSGAEIYIDNVDQGIITPGVVTGLTAGTHSYRLTLAGYTDAIGSFTITAGSTTNVPASFAAGVTFTSTPSGASVYLDGSLTSSGTTPTTITGLTAGSHSYILTHAGYADASGTFNAIAGQGVNVSVTFLGSAYITSTPSGASVYLDGSGTSSGITPITVTGLSAGTHSYRFTIAGYADATGNFSITAGTTTNVSGTFTGNLNISSTPTNSSIYLDGSPTSIGTTPTIKTGLSVGTHSYRLTIAGYADATGNFSISAGATTDLSVTFSGNASVTSTPTGARIYIDGIDKGISPNTVTGLSAGSHNYRLTLTGYIDATGNFSITAGTTTDVPVTFSGSAYFTSNPSSASIYLDGSPTSIGTTPLRITNLTAQSFGATTLHSYILRLTGYADVSDSFTATAGQTINVGVTFPGSAYFTSNPSGASIYLDGNPTSIGTTPITITNLSNGHHTYILTLSGFANVSGGFDITAGTTTPVSSTFLGSLEVLSTPTGAKIFIDNTDTGRVTPDTITGISQGTHSFKLTKSGFADITGTVPIVDAETTIINETFKGNLDIGSVPTGASIYLDGSLTSSGTTPYVIMGLLPGSHDIKLTLTNYYDWTGSATVSNASTTDVNATLTPKYGSINIKSTPHGATIYLDGSQTPIGIINSPTWTIVPDISVGSHSFKLSHIDYGDVTGNFDIYPNQVTQITAVLDPTPGVPPSYAVWDPTTRARLRVYKCKKIDIEQEFSIDKPTLSFDYQITADANPEIIRWQLIIGGNIVTDDVIPATSYGTSTGHITKNVSAFVPSTGTIKLYVESGPDCESITHENTYLYLDNVQLS